MNSTKTEVSVFIDKRTPYDVVARVLYTLGSVGFGRYEIVLKDVNGKYRTSPQGTTVDQGAGSSAQLALGKDSVGVRFHGDGQEEVIIPNKSGAYDFDALAKSVRGSAPIIELRVGADPSIEFQFVEQALETVVQASGTRDVSVLFSWKPWAYDDGSSRAQ